MDNQEELLNNLKEREEYLSNEFCQLANLAVNTEDLEVSKEIWRAVDATQKALRSLRRLLKKLDK